MLLPNVLLNDLVPVVMMLAIVAIMMLIVA
jgi:hypothetical protein